MSKRALLVGINHFRPGLKDLQGCVRDAKQMKSVLTNYFAFGDIRVLTNGEATAQGIRDGLSWLLSDYEGGGKDVRVFHFSSHGTQVPDENDEELDYVDEVIVPHDHDWANPFRDDELREIFDGIPEQVNFTFIADCCHSGTVQRALEESKIQFNSRYLLPPPEIRDAIKERKARKSDFDAWAAARLTGMLQGIPVGEHVRKIKSFMAQLRKMWLKNRYEFVDAERHVLLAGCEDRETAAEAQIEGKWRGAFTWALSQAIEDAGGDLTYEQLIADAGSGLAAYWQTPQLECPTEMQKRKVFAPLA